MRRDGALERDDMEEFEDAIEGATLDKVEVEWLEAIERREW